MPGPKLECGTPGHPACPPENAAAINGTDYTPEQMQAYGHENYHKGRNDLLAAITAVIEDPNHGWSEGEMARAIRAAVGGSR